MASLRHHHDVITIVFAIVGEYYLFVQKYITKQSKLRFDCSKCTKSKIL